MEEELLKQYNLKIAQFSEQGLRSKNEDRLFYSCFGSNRHLLIVADGMGGYEDGDLAAEIAIETISDVVMNSGGGIIENIELAFFNAHTTINKKLLNAGATIGGVIFWEDDIYIFWAGDVKIIINNGGDIFISHDHTLLNTLRDAEITIKPEEVKRLRSTVMRSIGGKTNSYTPEIIKLKMSKHCKGIICTDGISQFYTNENLLNILSNVENIPHFIPAPSLVNAIDNVTTLAFIKTM